MSTYTAYSILGGLGGCFPKKLATRILLLRPFLGSKSHITLSKHSCHKSSLWGSDRRLDITLACSSYTLKAYLCSKTKKKQKKKNCSEIAHWKSMVSVPGTRPSLCCWQYILQMRGLENKTSDFRVRVYTYRNLAACKYSIHVLASCAATGSPGFFAVTEMGKNSDTTLPFVSE